MYMLQLFDIDDDVAPLDARLLRDGTLSIGRDPSTDWPIVDPECALSRNHCELEAVPGGLRLRVTGANGVFDAGSGERFPDTISIPLPLPGAIRLGRFRIAAAAAPMDDGMVDVGRTLVLTPPLGDSAAVPSDWSDAHIPAAPTLAEGSLLEAFCDGAGLDPSVFSVEEPVEVMRRAGAVYRQMVLGVGDLMAERDRARARYQLTRTTIGGSGNNPFKWAPTQRLAIDLLLARSDSFLSGPAAIRASFQDVKRHLVATFAGLHGSLRAAVDSFAPATLDSAAAKRSSFLKGRAAAQGEEVAARHADLDKQLSEGAQGSLDAAFVAAYDAADGKIRRETP